MKKLLVTMIGAAAISAFADPAWLVGEDFEGADFVLDEVVTTNELNAAMGEGKVYWTDNPGEDVTNTYKVVARGAYTGRVPEGFPLTQNKALEVKTTFGNPLSFNVQDGGAPKDITTTDDRLYFDSLVKFTVCEETPTEEYDGAKIVMWLQEELDANNDIVGTNLMVKAGYLSYANDQVKVTNKTYKCGNTIGGDFADKWHRVTIKAFADITNGKQVPGFRIYIDGGDEGEMRVSCSETAKKDASFTFGLNEAVGSEGTYTWNYVFPSLVQGGDYLTTIESVSFDGTGTLDALEFTPVAPDFAEDPESPAIEIEIDGGEATQISTFGEAVDMANRAEFSATIRLQKGIAFGGSDEPVEFTGSADITLDFAGFVITNNLLAAAITNRASSLTITNSTAALGGIYCAEELGYAFYVAAGSAVIQDGALDGYVKAAPAANLAILGGYFRQVYGQLQDYLEPYGKTLVEDAETGLNKVVEAEVITWTVTFDANGGELSDVESVEVKDMGTVERPEDPTRDGYTFIGWFWDDPEDGEPDLVEFQFDEDELPTEVRNDITLYANWEATAPTTFTITVAALNAHTTVSVISNKIEVGTTAGAYVFESGDEAIVTFTPADGYDFANNTSTNIAEVTENVAIAAATVTAHDYSINYVLDLVGATNATDAVTSFTIEDVSVTLLPAGCDGYTFNGWTNANGTAVSTFVPAELASLANQTFYASWSAVTPTPTPIDPSADVVETTVTAATESEAKENVAITPPAGSGADAAEYKELFDFTATDNHDGTWTVTLTGIKDEVEAKVGDEAVKALTTDATSMEIPAGLFYRITPSTTLPISGASFGGTTPSTGSVSVEAHKPASTDAGFYRIELDHKPITNP